MRNDDVAAMFVFGFLAIAIIVGIAIQVFFLLTVSRCLSNIRPRNRDLEPGLVWLNLIPCVPLVFNFFIVMRVGSSLRKEFRSRHWRTSSEGFGTSVGLAYAICSIVSGIPYVGLLAAIPAFVCWIIYWVQIAAYKSRLESESPTEFPDEFEDEEDDFDAPRRSRRRDEDELDDRYRSDRPTRRRRDEYDDDEPDDRIRAR